MGRKMGLMASIRTWVMDKAKANQKGKVVTGEGDELENEELFPFVSLPASIITDHIMSQLPIKTLAICRLVCKAWNALVSDPYFVRLHLQCASPGVMILADEFHRMSRTIYFLDLEMFGSMLRIIDDHQELEFHLEMFDRNSNNRVKFVPAFKLPLRNAKLFRRNQRRRIKFGVVNSCNGLLCLCSPCKRDLIICNPLTGEFINLPKSIRTKKTRGRVLEVGFGFQPTTNEYKVVRIWVTCVTPKRSLFVEIHTLGKPGWRKVSVDNYEFLTNIHYVKFPTCVNGTLHWIYFDERKRSILSFNFESERFQPFPSPPNGILDSDLMHFSMAELGGFLYVSDGTFCGSCIMWVMKSYGVGESWTKVFNIDFVGIFFWHYGLCWPVKHVKNGVAILIQTNNSFLYYEPENNGYKLLRIIEPQPKSFEVIPHIPSLVSLKKVVNEDNIKVLNVHSRRFNHRLEEEDEVLFLKRDS